MGGGRSTGPRGGHGLASTFAIEDDPCTSDSSPRGPSGDTPSEGFLRLGLPGEDPEEGYSVS